jgi:UDP-N-acetylmuramate--alanine ligase
VTSEVLFRGIRERGHKNVLYVPRKEALADRLISLLKPGDTVITLGAGDIWQLAEELVRKLQDLA